jgi:hypothetical protein
MSTESKTVGIRMARATQDDVDRILAFMHFIEEWIEYGTHTPHNGEEEEESIVLDDSQFVEKLRELWGGRFTHRIGVDACYNRVINGYQVLHDNVCDPDKDYLDWKPEIAAQLVNSEKLDEVVSGMNGDPNHFRQILCDKNKLLERICTYAELKASRQNEKPWSIIQNITAHGSGVSAAIFELYRRKDSE